MIGIAARRRIDVVEHAARPENPVNFRYDLYGRFGGNLMEHDVVGHDIEIAVRELGVFRQALSEIDIDVLFDGMVVSVAHHARLLEDTPSGLHEAVIVAASADLTRFSLTAQPVVTETATSERAAAIARDLSNSLGGGPERVRVAPLWTRYFDDDWDDNDHDHDYDDGDNEDRGHHDEDGPDHWEADGLDDLFRARLDQIINMRHELVRLAEEIDWAWIDDELSVFYCDRGRPAVPTRFMVGLLLLKHIHGLSDEGVCERWVSDPYFQYFTGESFFRHELPHERSGLSHWRKHIGDKLEVLLQESLRVAHDTGALKKADLARITVGTTVQPKNVSHPTAAKLMVTAIRQLGSQHM